MKRFSCLPTLLIYFGCLSAPPTDQEHPCETAEYCVYNAEDGESTCEEGYTWADPRDATNYNCVSLEDDSCAPTSCDVQDAECGSIPDGCGTALECGTCESGLTCGAAGPNQCGEGECTPTTCQQTGAECGSVSDGCGNVLDCGTCATGFSCNESASPPCASQTPACPTPVKA